MAYAKVSLQGLRRHKARMNNLFDIEGWGHVGERLVNGHKAGSQSFDRQHHHWAARAVDRCFRRQGAKIFGMPGGLKPSAVKVGLGDGRSH